MANLLGILATLVATNTTNTTAPEYAMDPYLEFRPAFARSLPVQILLTGVILTLVAVLFIHLIFTAQYHWPLAPVNYVLQLSGVTTLLISLIATIHVVLSASFAESEKWPYMLSYIAVSVPPQEGDMTTDGWSAAERATWLVMNASTSGLIQITHIQFLTLLYPSRLEGRLIFTLLGPLAVVAAVMQLVPISGSTEVSTVAMAVRNVCNATLSLLFTVALSIWGLLVNRKQAWRTDGGTAAFGCAALTLAFVSTALNFLYVHREDEFAWLPGLMWAVVLWQSFLGWWWWVGAGSGAGQAFLGDDEDVEERLKREAKRESRRREARERRKETKNRAKKVWKDVAGALVHGNSTTVNLPAARSRTTTQSLPEPPSPTSLTSPAPSIAPSTIAPSASSTSTLPRLLPNIVHRWYASLRRAHVAAARQQAVERVERIRELERETVVHNAVGWGLGSFGWRVWRDAEGIAPNDRREVRDENHGSEYELREHEHESRRWETGEELTDRNEIRLEEVSVHYSKYDSEREEGNRSEEDERISNTSITQAHPQSEQTQAVGEQQRRPRSFWWWGPLWRWRLQDSTVY